MPRLNLEFWTEISKGRLAGFEENAKETEAHVRQLFQFSRQHGCVRLQYSGTKDVFWCDDAEQNTSHDFGKDIIPTLIANQRSVCTTLPKWESGTARTGVMSAQWTHISV